MMNKEKKSIPVRYATRAEMMEERRCQLREYERRHKMSSEEMVNLMDNNAIPATMEFIKWYHTYDVLRFFFAKPPTTGTPGTTTNMSTNAV